MMVKEYGEAKAEEMLKEFQVQVKWLMSNNWHNKALAVGRAARTSLRAAEAQRYVS